jgi:hypothetical protein
VLEDFKTTLAAASRITSTNWHPASSASNAAAISAPAGSFATALNARAIR